MVEPGKRLLKRARAAYWSRFWLLLSALLTWISFLSGPNVEDCISGLFLTGMTVVEFKVYSLFSNLDSRGSIYGWWNQCLFSLWFLVYGGYHGTFVSIPPSIRDMLDPELLPILVSWERIFYYTVAGVGAIAQFYLACYYRTARVKEN